jgi:hypothetical protein
MGRVDNHHQGDLALGILGVEVPPHLFRPIDLRMGRASRRSLRAGGGHHERRAIQGDPGPAGDHCHLARPHHRHSARLSMGVSVTTRPTAPPLTRLAQDEEPGSASGEARDGGGVGFLKESRAGNPLHAAVTITWITKN